MDQRLTSTPNKRVLFLGYMAGARQGFTTSQGFVVARLMENAGWPAMTVSKFHNRWLRLLEMLVVLVRDSGKVSLGVLEVYGGRGFILADIVSAVARLRKLPLIMVLHGGSIPDLVRQSPGRVHRVLSRARVLIAPSRFQARALEALPDLPVRIIPNVLAIEQYPFVRREQVRPRLFWMRAFHDIYNPMMALRVLKRLREDFPETELCMAGREDENWAKVRRAAQAAGLDDAVSFPGFLDMEGKLNAAATCDIFLNTNRIDNMPVAVVEACALGLPVVATAVGGIPDLLTDGETGLLVPDDDDKAMAEAIKRLLVEPGLAARLSQNGRKLAEESSASHVVPRWSELFREIAEANTP